MNQTVSHLPPLLARDGRGYIWRVFDRGLPTEAWSMAPNNPDNSPIPQPVTYYVPADRVEAMEAAIARLMRHQAKLAEALDLGEDDDLSAELVSSRDAAKRALGR